ncbi:MAG: ABC transporter permease subunit [Bacilli bacterium]|nr:ABC transporter permease subunit [Bacilli bacterium]
MFKVDEKEKEAVVLYYEKNHWSITLKRMLRDWRLYVMLIPLILVFFFWKYLPMYGLTLSFKNYDSGLGILGSDFIGLAGFKFLVSDPTFWRAFRNTFMLAFYGLLFGFPIPIILALLFSEVKNKGYRSFLQVATYLPKFVSIVVITSLVTLLCTKKTDVYQGGLITQLLAALKLIPEGTDLLKSPQYFRAIYQISGIWEGAGYGSIVYFAAVLAISPTSYEAAKMDGASKWAQIINVTLPGMASTITIMLILDIGKLFTIGYEKVYLLYQQETWETADIVATYVMRHSGMASDGIVDQLSKAIAASADLLNAVIAMLLVVGSNIIARRVSDTSLY